LLPEKPIFRKTKNIAFSWRTEKVIFGDRKIAFYANLKKRFLEAEKIAFPFLVVKEFFRERKKLTFHGDLKKRFSGTEKLFF